MFPEAVITNLQEVSACDDVLEHPEWLEAVEAAIDAMSHKVPAKPVDHGEWSAKTCPACGEDLSTHVGDGVYTDSDWLEYCPNGTCHQAIDWTQK